MESNKYTPLTEQDFEPSSISQQQIRWKVQSAKRLFQKKIEIEYQKSIDRATRHQKNHEEQVYEAAFQEGMKVAKQALDASFQIPDTDDNQEAAKGEMRGCPPLSGTAAKRFLDNMEKVNRR